MNDEAKVIIAFIVCLFGCIGLYVCQTQITNRKYIEKGYIQTSMSGHSDFAWIKQF